MLSYSHMTIWANQSWLALGLDLDGLWSWKLGMVLVMNPLVIFVLSNLSKPDPLIKCFTLQIKNNLLLVLDFQEKTRNL